MAAQEDGREFAGEVVPTAAVSVVGQLPEEEGGGAGEQHRRDVPTRRARGGRGFAVAQVFQFVVETVIALVLPRRIISGAPGGNQRALLGGRIGRRVAAVRRAQQGQEGEEGKEEWREEVGHGVQGAGVWELDFAAGF